jgi:iron complex outermembrane receptor protein
LTGVAAIIISLPSPTPFPEVKTSLFSAALSAALVAPALAAPEKDTELAEMKVSEARPALDPTLPAVIEGIDAGRLADLNVVNVEDGLRYMPGLLVRKRYIGDRNGVVASRSSGSLQGARSLVYADGMLLSNLLGNSFGNTPRWGMVAPEEIERMDVAYGPYSALYPGNSMGATVAMTTRAPEKPEASGRVQVFAQRYDRYRTDDSYSGHQESFTGGGRSGALSWFLAANHLENRSHPMTFATATASAASALPGDPAITGFARDTDPQGNQRIVFGATGIDDSRQDNFKLKLGYEFAPRLKLTYLFGLWQNVSAISVDSYLRDSAGQTVYSGTNLNMDGRRYTLGATTFNPSRRSELHSMHGLALRTGTRGEWDMEAVITRYNFDEDKTLAPSTALPAAGGSGAGTAAFGDGTGWRTLDLKTDWRPRGSAHALTFGLHYDRYILRTLTLNATNWISAATTTRKDFFGGKSETHALFAQDVWRFAPAWSLTAGLRYERWRAFDGQKAINAATDFSFPSRKEFFRSPKLSLARDLGTEWRLRASVGRAWRMPTVSEMFQGSVSAGSIVNSDPNLLAERATSGEFTAERSLEGGLLRVTLFRDAVRDALYSQTNVTVTPNVTSIQNIDSIRTDGIEVAYGAENVGLRGLDFNAGVTYADSEILKNDKFPASVGKRVPRIPDWRINAAAIWRQTERLSWTLGLRYSGRQVNTLDNSDINPDTYAGTSRYAAWDARVSWQLDRHLRLAFGVDNLFDQRYFVAHPYPGRTAVLELRGKL